jgi:hypothetical protein
MAQVVELLPTSAKGAEFNPQYHQKTKQSKAKQLNFLF